MKDVLIQIKQRTHAKLLLYVLQNQYRFLYYVLHENFRAKGRVRSKSDFIQEVESEISSNKAVNLSKFMKEFNVRDFSGVVFFLILTFFTHL